MLKKLKNLVWVVIGLTIGLFFGVAVTTLAGNITGTGMYQGDLFTFLTNTVTLSNELRTDHGTNKTTVDESRTAIIELIDDHATFKTSADALKLFMGNELFSDAGVAIGSDAKKVKTAATANYKVDGVFYTKAATDDLWTLSGTTVTSGNAQKYLLCLDSAGTASIVEGTQGANAAAVVLPAAPASKCVVGLLLVETTGDFVPGTTDLSAATITDTYTDGYAPALIGDAPATLTATDPTASAASITASALSLTGL
jgi:hypothetical protein